MLKMLDDVAALESVVDRVVVALEYVSQHTVVCGMKYNLLISFR